LEGTALRPSAGRNLTSSSSARSTAEDSPFDARPFIIKSSTGEREGKGGRGGREESVMG
jgi:hypothetical protein